MKLLKKSETTSDGLHLLDLALQKDIETLCHALQALPDETVFPFLSELFIGNGFDVAFHYRFNSITHLLLKEQDGQVMMIVKFAGLHHALSLDETRNELKYIEEHLAHQYNCYHYCIFSLSGFTDEAFRFEQLNVLMHDRRWLKELVYNFSPGKKQKPKITLFAHNQRTYRKVVSRFNDHSAVAVVQATGTGKSFLIARLLQDHSSVRALVLAPSWFILNQLRSHLHFNDDHITFMTYCGCMYLTDDEIKRLNVGFIVLDEYHRAGADEWGWGVTRILSAFPKALKFGTSATPVRYSDNGRDMSLELFGGNVAENINLAQAIARKILPMPKYVCALYTLQDDSRSMRRKIAESKRNDSKKEELTNLLDKSIIDWEQTKGIPEILKKHCTSRMRKFIIFCKDQIHLEEMQPIVTGWFHKAGLARNVINYTVHSQQADSLSQFTQFKLVDNNDAVHLLFSVNMLNEGIHLPDIDGVILLRPTQSPTIFYQQIGRALKVGQKHIPVIFDLVNNFRNIRSFDFASDITMNMRLWNNMRHELGMSEQQVALTFHDEVREIVGLFGEIEFHLSSWEDMYDQLVDFKRKHEHLNVSAEEEQFFQLWTWSQTQRKSYKAGVLNAERLKKLRAVGFVFDLLENNWQENFEKLMLFKEVNGHCNVPAHSKEDVSLSGWVNNQRIRYKQGKISSERISKLLEMGFEFSLFENRWQTMFEKLAAFKMKYGRAEVLRKDNEYNDLMEWLRGQRKTIRNKTILPERYFKLKELGVSDERIIENKFPKNIERLIEYKKTYGTAIVSGSNKEYKGLAEWMHNQRKRFKNGRLDQDKIDALKKIGFVFEASLKQTKWKEYYALLLEFKKEFGHTAVFKNTDQKRYRNLYRWVLRQKDSIQQNSLSKEKKQMLLDIDFIVSPEQSKWDRKYEELCEYKQDHGQVNAFSSIGEERRLSKWVMSQRMMWREGTLSTDKIAKLQLLGVAVSFGKDRNNDTWEAKYRRLMQFKETYKHCNVPLNWEADKGLGTWVSNMRRANSKGILSPQRKSMLDQLDFTWNKEKEKWDDFYPKLVAIKNKYGHTVVTPSLSDNNSEFHSWVATMRENFLANKLSQEKMNMLKKIGFASDTTIYLVRWNNKYNLLEAFFKEHGHCKVTARQNKTLSLWVLRQRKDFLDQVLPQEQIKKLNALNFDWSPMANDWEKRFAQLMQYKTENNLAMIHTIKNNHSLSVWVKKQLVKIIDNTLPEDKRMKLLAAGLVLTKGKSLIAAA